MGMSVCLAAGWSRVYLMYLDKDFLFYFFLHTEICSSAVLGVRVVVVVVVVFVHKYQRSD